MMAIDGACLAQARWRDFFQGEESGASTIPRCVRFKWMSDCQMQEED